MNAAMQDVPRWLQAGGWGLLSGSALLIGAALGYGADIPRRVVAGVMAFGSGVLISALSFELMDEAYKTGGLAATAFGFLAGAILYTGADRLLARYGHRDHDGGGAIALGALLDGIPESIVIGLSLLKGGIVSSVTVAAIFLSNLPEGLSSAAGMKAAGRSPRSIFGIWGGIALSSGLAAIAGYSLFRTAAPETVAATTAVAAGAILAMLVDTMIPEAFDDAHEYAGLITVLGFLTAFALSKAG